MKIEKKIWPEYFNLIVEGRKKYEIRLNDFETNAGDIIILHEWDPKTKNYTGRSLRKEVTFVNKIYPDKLFWSKEEIQEKGLQIISFE